MERKVIKRIFEGISILTLVVGIYFSYLLANSNYEIGYLYLGATGAIILAALIYGYSEIIDELKKKNKILKDIQKSLTNKK